MKRIRLSKKTTEIALTAALVASQFVGCGTTSTASEVTQAESTATTTDSEVVTNLSQIDNTKWLYNEDDDVYYQLGIQYCENPADTDYEELAIIVPAAYMDATDNGDGTYTCTINYTAEVNGYTAETAPIVFPVNTPDYAAQSPMTEYTSVSEYTDAGFIYVHAGCRGRDAGTPDGMDGAQVAEDGVADEEVDYTAIDDISRIENTSGTFETVQDYIDVLNTNGTWVTYDEATNTATITSIEDFAEAVKTASKGIAAFDQLDGSQGENTLFGYNDGEGTHFDSTLASILEEIGSEYASDYEEDLSKEDSVGNTVDYRVNMYSHLYYFLSNSEGYQTSNVAKYFRVNTGIWQSDTAVNAEANLVRELQNYGANVDYSFVWGQEHTMAERSGDSTSNFI